MSRIETVPHSTEPARSANRVSGQIARHCVLTRTRQIARVLTAIYDEALRPLGINAPQLSLLVLIAEFGPLSRAALGRKNHHDRSTLSRNLQPLIAQGWVVDSQPAADGRSRALYVTQAGDALLSAAGPAWSTAQQRAASLLGEEGANALVNIAAGLPPAIA
jgi:DNA-binding MarR family transcriptional regulator